MNKFLHQIAKIYWFIFRPKTLGVKIVVRNGGDVLMIKNSYGGWNKWMFPGGGVNKNESLEKAAKREVKEEVGIDLMSMGKIGEYTSNKEYKRDTVYVFQGEALSKDFKIDTREIAEAQWFDLNNLPEVSDYSRKIVAML